MLVNELPRTDRNDLEPGCCCPGFDPAKWDRLDLHFRDKPFVHARSRSLFHIPLNMSPVFDRTWNAIKQAGAEGVEQAVFTDDQSAWHADHYFCVDKHVPGADNVMLTGDFITRVFEGPYRDAPIWVGEMREAVTELGFVMGRLYFYYTSCPHCAEKRGKNYVVAIAELTRA